MIVHAAITPHSPMLIPSIGKEHASKLSCTAQAFAQLTEDLYVAKPNTIVMISPHATMYPDAFSGNIADTYKGVLKEFGDHGTAVELKPDYPLSDHVHRHMRTAKIPYTMTSSEEIDYGYTVPLYHLVKTIPQVKLLPITTSLLSKEWHIAFGQALKEVLHSETHRISVIASAELSHHANQASPEGYKAEGEQFDKAVRAAVSAKDHNALLGLDDQMLEAAGQCGFMPILILMSMLEEMNCTPKELCYEAPFGVGYLTSSFTFA